MPLVIGMSLARAEGGREIYEVFTSTSMGAVCHLVRFNNPFSATKEFFRLLRIYDGSRGEVAPALEQAFRTCGRLLEGERAEREATGAVTIRPIPAPSGPALEVSEEARRRISEELEPVIQAEQFRRQVEGIRRAIQETRAVAEAEQISREVERSIGIDPAVPDPGPVYMRRMTARELQEMQRQSEPPANFEPFDE
jgi:hypothetical protein